MNMSVRYNVCTGYPERGFHCLLDEKAFDAPLLCSALYT